MDIIPTGQTLGARIEGIDLAARLSDADFRTTLRALGQHGVLCFPNQTFDTPALAAFARRFGDLEVNVANLYYEPDFPEIMILSNQIRPDGKPVGMNDAGQGWHTDMSYSKDIALANILHAQAVPMRNGKSVGETQFRNMHAAYDELPEAIKDKIVGRTATHDFEKFWEVMRHRPGSRRPALTPEQKRKKPPVSQPLVRVHPHRAEGAVCQSRIHDVDRWHGSRRERHDSGIPVPPSGARGFPVCPSLGGRRRADVGQHWHRPQRGGRLHAKRTALHAARAGHGDARLPAPSRRITPAPDNPRAG
jgi:alpha-ketoglutarate-dependent taurine dioxygenase